MAIPVQFKYEDLESFSGNFSDENKLGEGGFADVYKGVIPHDNGYKLRGQFIAIKKAKDINPNKREIQEKQFDNEKKWLSRLNHPNIIKLIGYCYTDQTRCLVLEYADKGTLSRCISDLDWRSTIYILKKLGSVLEYIHFLPGGQIHGDVKTNNVLITEENEPKLSDFGSFMCEAEAECVTEDIHTIGYVDPEHSRRPVKTKLQCDDVYAFGVIILQMITKYDQPKVLTNQTVQHIAEWAREVLEENTILVDEMLLNTGCSKSHAKMISALAIELTEVTNEDNTKANRIYQRVLARAMGQQLDDSRSDDTDQDAVVGDTQDGYIERPKIGYVVRKLEELKVSQTTLEKIRSKRLCF